MEKVEQKQKVLILYNYILHYRKPFFNQLAKKYQVTVLHSGQPSVTEDDDYTEIITPVKKLGPFMFQSGVFKAVFSDEYDIIISLFDVRWVNILLYLLVKKPSQQHVLWGAWITDSRIANHVRAFFMKRADASVFYTYEALADFLDYGMEEQTMYVGNNTFDVGSRIKSFESPVKNRILFVGSLNKRKENDVLLKAFASVKQQLPQDILLTFIGQGSESESLKALSSQLNLGSEVEFLGKINDPEALKEYYQQAIVSVSFGQAGLAVLQSLGYGVPFLTKHNAISGGEKSNIKNNVNSVFCEDSQQSLEQSLVKLCTDIDYARALGEAAFDYYSQYCTIENMTQGFLDAMEGTRLTKVDK